jgi:hypothetical protein
MMESNRSEVVPIVLAKFEITNCDLNGAQQSEQIEPRVV